MRDLNSVLFEGEVRAVDKTHDNTPCAIRVLNNGIYGATDAKREPPLITVDLSSMSPDACNKLAKGCYLRVVGRLDMGPKKGMFIAAEHIEVRPEASRTA